MWKKKFLGNHPNIGDKVGHQLDIDRHGHTTRWLILLPPLVLYVNVSRNNTLIFCRILENRCPIHHQQQYTKMVNHQIVSLRNLYRGKEKRDEQQA